MMLPDLSGALIKTPTKNNILVLARLQSPTSALNLQLESRLGVFYITTTRLINVMDDVVNTHVFSGSPWKFNSLSFSFWFNHGWKGSF